MLLGNAENELGNKAAAVAAMEKAQGYPETKEMAGTWLKMIKGRRRAQEKVSRSRTPRNTGVVSGNLQAGLR